MKFKKQALVITILIHTLFIIVVYVFQAVIFPYMRLSGLVPLLLPLASTGIALYEGQYTGGIAGLFAGVLCDISFNQPVGIFTIVLTVTGLLVGAFADAYILPGFVTYFISCAVVLVFSTIVQMFPLIFLEMYGIPFQVLIPTAIQQLIYSLVFVIPLWFFVRALGKRTERTTSPGRVL